MAFFIRCACLLGFALLAPITLPAGGGAVQTKITLQRRLRSNFSPLIAGDNCFLLSSPLKNAPSLRKLENGTPLTILRTWNHSQEQMWLYVRLSSSQVFDKSTNARRGWINV